MAGQEAIVIVRLRYCAEDLPHHDGVGQRAAGARPQQLIFSYAADRSEGSSSPRCSAGGLANAQNGARRLIQGLREESFINTPNNVADPVEDQTLLVAAIAETVNALKEGRKSELDPRQVVRACLAAAWRHWNVLDDVEWESAEGDLEPEIDALRSVCEPHGDGLNNDE